jgi:hypothetical protein
MRTNGSDWIKTSHKKPMSEFGENVANMLDWLFKGIYHIDGPALQRVDWTSNNHVRLTLSRYASGSLSTYDFDLLTAIVLASHDLSIRVTIEPNSFDTVRMLFHPRQRDDGKLDISRRMPEIEAHIARLRERVY